MLPLTPLRDITMHLSKFNDSPPTNVVWIPGKALTQVQPCQLALIEVLSNLLESYKHLKR